MHPPWPGCHGVRLRPDELGAGYGRNRGTPLAEAVLVRGPAGPPGVDELWRIVETVGMPGGDHEVDQRLQRRRDGTFVLVASGATVCSVDPSTNRIMLATDDLGAEQQLVATIALPLLLHATPALVLHASAFAADGRATVVCGPSGTGKSSLLVGMMATGRQAVSEDMCAVDPSLDPPMVWPGPPWVRRNHADPPPAGAALRFSTPDKYAWDIDDARPREPVSVERLVFLEPSGGDEVEWEPLGPPEALARLAPLAVWLGPPEQRSTASFGPCTRLVNRVATARLRLPVSDSWLERAAEVLGSG